MVNHCMLGRAQLVAFPVYSRFDINYFVLEYKFFVVCLISSSIEQCLINRKTLNAPHGAFQTFAIQIRTDCVELRWAPTPKQRV